MRRGFSLIDLILAIGIIATLFGGIFLVYFSIVDTAVNFELRRAAASILSERVELVRGLAYEQVGTVGGIPTGVLQPSEQVDWDGRLFVLSSAVRNIDDPFDGTVTSTPSDTAPADYKLVSFDITCPTCARFTPVSITTTVAPRGLESASQNGSLFISVFDADGLPVAGADVHIVNTSTTPSINFTDITDTNGVLQLVDVPTSTQSYAVTVTKAGYSTDRTYPLGDSANPNPMKVHATVGSQAVTELSFAIDGLATVPVYTRDARCQVIPDESFSVTGNKLIGTSPDVLKFTTTTTSGTSGITTLALEWDTYTFSYTGARDLAGTVPYQPVTIAPSSTQPFSFILAPATPRSLLVTLLDRATGAPLTGEVTLTGPASVAGRTSVAAYSDTSWSSTTVSQEVVLGSDLTRAPAGGPYATSTDGWVESGTIDLGGTPSGPLSLSWDATTPSGTSVRFQVAGSDTGNGWTYLGPDGTSATFFTNPSDLPNELTNKRFVRYKVWLTTTDANTTPTLSAVTILFTGPCVPPGQRLFQGLSAGTYTVTATVGGYQPSSVDVSVSSPWQESILMLDPS